MLLLPAAFATNPHLLLRGQTPHCKLLKKEAIAAAPPVYQRQHQREKFYKSRQLGII
jgi:hypothetical protein